MCQNCLLASFCHCSTVVSFDALVRWVVKPYHDTLFGVFVQINDELNWETALACKTTIIRESMYNQSLTSPRFYDFSNEFSPL